MMMLSFLILLLVVAGHNQTVSPTTQEDAKLAAILDRISKTSLEGRQVIEKTKGLKPELNEQVSTKTLGEMVDEYAKNKGAYNITPIGWEVSQKKPLPDEKNERWKIVFDYRDWQKQLLAAEWEYNADTNKLYPFEGHNAPQFWNAAPQKIDPGVSVLTDSVQRSLAAFRGKIVILNFWATWCGPCRNEIPAYIALQNKYRDQGLEIVGVSIDPIAPRGNPGGAAAVAPFIKDNGINYHVWMVDNPASLAGYDVSQGIPTTYVLNREGRIVRTNVGARSFLIYEDEIKQLLSQHPKTECEPLVSTQAIDQAGKEFDVGMKMLNCVRQEGVKSVAHARSPSGDRYVFVGEFSQRWDLNRPPFSREKADLWMVNVNGTGLQRLTTNGTSYDPEWSPDGNEIVFIDKGSINVLDTRSKKVRTIREASISSESDTDYNYVYFEQPKWSGNGKAIAVLARDVHYNSRSTSTHSVRVEVITDHGQQLCHFARGVEHHQWNKEGELLLGYGKFIFDWDSFIFGHKRKPQTNAEEVRAGSDEAADRLRDTLLKRVISYGVIRVGDYAVAPSGSRIAFVGEFEGNTDHASQESDLWLVNLDGTGLRRLTENRDSSEPAWSPSGKAIAFVNDGNVKIINVKTRSIRSLPDLLAYHPKPEDRTHDNWDVVYMHPQWSLNGKVIAAQRWDDLSDGAMTAVDARLGTAIFETNADSGGSTFSWNHEGELIVGQIGKFVFDWDKTFWYESPRKKQARYQESYEAATALADPLLDKLLERVAAKGVKRIREYFPSPSGERLVFVGEFEDTWALALQSGRPQTDLWLINRDGSGLRRLTTDGMSYDPDWSTFGNEIAFADQGSIKIINIRTGAKRVLRALRSKGGPFSCEGVPTEYGGPVWSTNGKAILAASGNGCAGGIAIADARSGKQFFETDSDEAEDSAWNDRSELLLVNGDSGSAKVVFDWEAIAKRPTRRASASLFLFKQDGKFGYFDTNGEAKIKPQFSDAGQFSEGLAAVAADGKWGYINKTGELTIQPRFDAALRFFRGVARVKIDGSWRLIDKRGKYVGSRRAFPALREKASAAERFRESRYELDSLVNFAPAKDD